MQSKPVLNYKTSAYKPLVIIHFVSICAFFFHANHYTYCNADTCFGHGGVCTCIYQVLLIKGHIKNQYEWTNEQINILIN